MKLKKTHITCSHIKTVRTSSSSRSVSQVKIVKIQPQLADICWKWCDTKRAGSRGCVCRRISWIADITPVLCHSCSTSWCAMDYDDERLRDFASDKLTRTNSKRQSRQRNFRQLNHLLLNIPRMWNMFPCHRRFFPCTYWEFILGKDWNFN